VPISYNSAHSSWVVPALWWSITYSRQDPLIPIPILQIQNPQSRIPGLVIAMAVRDCNPYSYWCLVCFHIVLYCNYILILALCFFAKSKMIFTLWKAFKLCWSHDGQDTIAVLWVKHGIMCGIKG